MFLCAKDHSNEALYMWVNYAGKGEVQHLVIPDYTIDMHAEFGQRMIRGKHHFLVEGALVESIMGEQERVYRKRLLIKLDTKKHGQA